MTQVEPHGIHHVTAIARDPQSNVDFYTRVLGLRLVKQTVNFDAPDTYHLYYGDEQGSPSSLLTFFPWPGVREGPPGRGPDHDHRVQRARVVARLVARAARAAGGRHRRAHHAATTRTSSPSATRTAWSSTSSPPTATTARAGTASPTSRPSTPSAACTPITLSERLLDPSAAMLTDLLGMSVTGEGADRARFEMADGRSGALVDVAGGRPGPRPAGGRHRAPRRLPRPRPRDHDGLAAGAARPRRRVTQILDRQYFKSIYFREPGGVLFEIATDAPGFAVDEPLLELGRHLKLPPWLEPDREQIAAALPPLRLDAE